ncbi:MAG TPA: AI-2E family transporter [Anaerolineales bacterium]|nr:AI-2E family transporter [Anaerolineales bacterium]
MHRTWDPTVRYIVLAAILVVLAALLWYMRALIKPLLVAGVIAYVLSPAAGLLMRRFHLSRRAAARSIYFLTLLILFVSIGTLVPLMLDQIQSVRADLQSAVGDLQLLLGTPLQFGLFRLDLRMLAPSLAVLIQTGPIVAQPSQALRFLEMTSRGVVWAVVIMMTVYYLMTEWDQLRAWVIELAPPAEQDDLWRLYRDIRDVWAQYLRGQLRLILILGLIYSAGWAIIGLPGAIALGLLAGMLNLIPEVGPAAVAALATLVAYLEGSRTLPGLSTLWFAALTLGVYLLINAFKTIWLQPRVLGRSVLLHEGLVFVAIICALILGGILGVLLVVPVLASALIVGKYLRRRMLGLPPFDEGVTVAAPASDVPLAEPEAESAMDPSPLAASSKSKKNSQ